MHLIKPTTIPNDEESKSLSLHLTNSKQKIFKPNSRIQQESKARMVHSNFSITYLFVSFLTDTRIISMVSQIFISYAKTFFHAKEQSISTIESFSQNHDISAFEKRLDTLPTENTQIFNILIKPKRTNFE